MKHQDKYIEFLAFVFWGAVFGFFTFTFLKVFGDISWF